MKKYLSTIAIGSAISVLALTSDVKADAVISFAEFGNNVIGSLSGSLDLTGATFSSTAPVSNANFINSFSLASGNGEIETQNEYDVSGPSLLGSLSGTVNSSYDTTKSSFYISSGNYFRVSPASDDVALSGQIGFENQSLTSLGLALGSSVYTFSNGETFTIEVTSVPEISTTGALAAFGSLLTMMAFLWERRRVAV